MNNSQLSTNQQSIQPLKDHLLIALILLLLSLVLRFPFFFPDVIDWDESTFILMGQSVLNGQLPYTELWDIKPPLAFVAYALFIFLGGKSIVAIRLGGAVCIAITAWLTYFVGRTIWNARLGILAGVLLVIFASTFKESLPVMTEHIALVPLMAALSLILSSKTSLKRLFIVGTLLATATLIRLNLAYVSLIMGILLLIVWQKPLGSWQDFVKGGIAYGYGNLLVIIATLMPYAITGELETWLSSVLLAPWMYATAQPSQSTGDAIASNGLSLLLLVGGLIGISLLTQKWHKVKPQQRTPIFLGVMFFIAVEISILKGGASFGHYTIQLYPFFALLAALFFNALLPNKTRLKLIVIVFTVLGVVLSPILPQYQTVLARAIAGKSLTYGTSYAIADYLKQANPDGEPVYLTIDHLAYWFTDLQPLSKSTTHPSNIQREYLFLAMGSSSTSSEMEMNHVLSEQPKFIVKFPELWYLEKQPQAVALLERVVAEKYELVKEIEGRQIYRRIQ